MVILLLSLGAPAAATATGGGNSSTPQPQKAAPSNTSPTPAPDPVSQAQTLKSTSETRVTTSHPVGYGVAVTPGSTPSSTSSPRVTAPTRSSIRSSIPRVRVPHLPAARPAAAPTNTAAPAPKYHAAPRRSAPRRPAATHKASPSHALFGVNLVSPNDLPRLSALAFAEANAGRPGGALLLSSALALGVLVLASLTLLRRLTRLHREWSETTPQ